MGKQNKIVGLTLLMTVVFFIGVDGRGQDLGVNKGMHSIETVYSINVPKDGIGVDQQEAISNAVGLLKQGQLSSAETILDGVLSRFTILMGDANKTYVCIRETKDYRQFLDEIQKKQSLQSRGQVIRVHDSFAHALQLKAYIASSRKDWDRAISYLNKKMSYAPYEAQPHLEIGYILNVQGRHKEAIESYRRGYALALAHGAVKTEQAMALRGMGFAQIELGRLDDAVDSFIKSLEIEPENKLALKELLYTEQIRARKP